MAHITGGGFTENLPRMFGDHLGAEIDLDSWQRPNVFAWLQQAGNIDEAEMLRTFNCGIGFVLCVDADVRDGALEVLREAGENPVDIGSIVDADAKPGPGHIVITAKGHRFG